MSEQDKPVAAVSEKLSETDILTLELAKCKKQVALSEAKNALSQNELAEVNYRYTVLQLYMKYGLTKEDAISENGEIVRGGAAQPASNT
jgi:hypothetical protein